MTLLEILVRAAGVPAGKLNDLLDAGAQAAPDLAPIAATLKSKLNEAITGEKLIALGKVLFSEGQDIMGGNLRPHSHPSDAA